MATLHLYISCLFILLFVELLFQSQSWQLQYQVYSDGNPYGIAEGIVFSMPCRSKVSLFTVFFILFNFYNCYCPMCDESFIH